MAAKGSKLPTSMSIRMSASVTAPGFAKSATCASLTFGQKAVLVNMGSFYSCMGRERASHKLIGIPRVACCLRSLMLLVCMLTNRSETNLAVFTIARGVGSCDLRGVS